MYLKARSNISRMRGFTLIELAIVMAIIGLLLGGGSMLLQPLLDNNRRGETKARLDLIEDALTLYVANNDDMPCPSNPALGAGAAANGAESDPATFCSGTMALGGVPWRTLGLSEADVLDGWGRRITYVVTGNLAVAAGAPLDCSALGFGGISQGVLENRGANDAAIGPEAVGTAGAAKAAYILISHGENGGGGFLPSGSRASAAAVSQTEGQNIKAVGAGTDVVFYYEKRIGTDAVIGFDDLVRSRTAGQISIEYGCSTP